MRIIQIATSTEGGAGIAARRLNIALNELGLDSTLLSGSNPKLRQLDKEVVHGKNLTLRYVSKLLTLFQQTFVQNQDLLVTPMSLGTLSAKEILKLKPDIVHLHSFYNLLDFRGFRALSESGIGMFLSLHDERLYTGGCHHALDCTNFQNKCIKCPETKRVFHQSIERSQKSLMNIFEKIPNLTVIAPSEWIAERARRSRVLGNAKIIVLNNPISEEFIRQSDFETQNKSKNNPFIVTFIAQDIFSPYKGLNSLIECITKFENSFINENIQFNFVGNGEDLKFEKIRFEQFKKIDPSFMSEIYKNSDLLIVPSMADNSPNVIFEALVCGIPFVGSNRGGIAEISRAFNMPTFTYGDPGSMYEAIIVQRRKAVDHRKIRNSALSRVHPLNVARKMSDIYQAK